MAKIIIDLGQRFFTIKELTLIFGVSRQTIHKWVRQSKLVPMNCEGRTLFLPSDVERFKKARENGKNSLD